MRSISIQGYHVVPCWFPFPFTFSYCRFSILRTYRWFLASFTKPLLFFAVFLKLKGQDANSLWNSALLPTFTRYHMWFKYSCMFRNPQNWHPKGRVHFSSYWYLISQLLFLELCSNACFIFSPWFSMLLVVLLLLLLLLLSSASDVLYWKFCIQGVLYGSVGFGCGLIGQGIANLIMTAKRYSFYLHDFSLVLFHCCS